MHLMRAIFLLLSQLMLTTLHAASLPDFTTLVEQHSAAVVNIRALKQGKLHNTLPHGFDKRDLEGPWGDFLKRFFEEHQETPQSSPRASGSGFIISADGYILTNQHVIEGADNIIVRLRDHNELIAKVIGIDKPSDIALLKVSANHLPFVKIGQSSKLKVGAWVLAIGSPFGLEHSVTAGIVSAKGRSLRKERYIPFIQTDVAINPGSSGGPLFNLQGEVVAVNAVIYSKTGGYMGLSFAIPIELAMEVTAQLKQQGTVRRGWLGVTVQPVTAQLANKFHMSAPQGALVTKILPHSPALTAHLKMGDIITQLNNTTIIQSNQLTQLIARSVIGETVSLQLLRDGKKQTISATVQELPNQQNTKLRPAIVTNSRLGVSVTDISSPHQQGIIVDDIDTTGIAYQAGIRKGDKIIMIKNKNINNTQHFNQIMALLKPNQSVAVLVQRPSGPVFLALQPLNSLDKR